MEKIIELYTHLDLHNTAKVIIVTPKNTYMTIPCQEPTVQLEVSNLNNCVDKQPPIVPNKINIIPVKIIPIDIKSTNFLALS